MSYWDTSALAKHYLEEPDSAAFEALGAMLAPIHTARITYYELHTVLRRRESEGVIAAGEAETCFQQFNDHIGDGVITLHDESVAVRDKFPRVLDHCFLTTPVTFIRASDALHIATALAAGETDFVTADIRQKNAAETCGLTVHP